MSRSSARPRAGITNDPAGREKLIEQVASLSALPLEQLPNRISQLLRNALPHDKLTLELRFVMARSGNKSNPYISNGDVGHGADEDAIGEATRDGVVVTRRQTESGPALLVAPVLEAGECLAALVFRRNGRRAFSSEEAALAEHVAASIPPSIRQGVPQGLAVESIDVAHLQNTARVNHALARIGRILSRSLNMADVYEEFAAEVAGLIRFDRFSLSHVDPRAGTVTKTYLSGAQIAGIAQGATKPYVGSTEQMVIEARRPLVISSGDASLKDKHDALRWCEAGFRSLVTAPLFWHEVPVGTIGLSSFSPNAFSAEDAELLRQISEQVAGSFANARLHARMAREAVEREGIARIGHAVAESLDLTTACNRLAEELQRLIPYDRMIITRLDEERGEILGFYAAGVEVPSRPANRNYPLSGTLTAVAAERGAPLRLDVTDEAELIGRIPGLEPGIRFGFRSFLAVPLRVESRTIGSINLCSFEQAAFTESHERLLSELATQVASAIHNAELHSQLREAAEERLALAEIGRIVGSAHDFSDIYDLLVEQIGRLVPADRVSITIQENTDSGRVVLTSGLLPEYWPAGTVFPLDGSVTGWILEHGRTLVTGASAGKALLREIPHLAEEFAVGFRSILSTPLLEAGEVIGVLHFRASAAGLYEPRHAAVAERIATQIAGSVANLGLREALEKEISVSNALAEISRMVNSSPDIHSVFGDVAAMIRDLTHCDRVTVGLIDTERERAIHFIVWGRGAENRREGWSSPLKGSIAEWLAKNRTPLIVNDNNVKKYIQLFPRLGEQDIAEGFNSMLSVPLLVGDVVRGALHLRATAHNAFTKHDAVLAERIAAQIAGAIVNSEHVVEARRTADERLALSRIGQVATSALEFSSVFPDIATLMARLFPAERIVVAEYDPQHDALVDRYLWGTEIPGSFVGVSYPLSSSIASEAFKSRSPMAWNRRQLERLAARTSSRKSRQESLLASGFSSAMVIPLIWQDKLYGVLSLRTRHEDAYGERELGLARQAAAQIAGAVVVSALYSETRRIADERLFLSDIARIVSSSLDFSIIFPEFAAKLSQAIPADRVVVAEFDPVNGIFTDRHIWGIEVPGDRDGATYAFGSSVAHEVFNTRQPTAWSEEALVSSARRRPTDAARFELGLRSLMAVPLIWQDRIFGILHIKSRNPDAYGDRQLDLAGQVGAQIAGAVAVSTLHAETQHAIDERTRVNEIGRLVSSSLVFGTIFDELSEKISEILPADRVVIATFDEQTNSYVDRYVWGVHVPGSQAGQRHAPGQSLSYLEEGNREPSSLPRRELEKYSGKVPGVEERLKAGLNSALRIPLIWQDRVFGELNIRSRLDDPYGPRQIRIAKEIGAQIVGAVAVSTLYEEAMRKSEELLALSEIGRIVSASLDFAETYESLAVQMQRLLPFDRLVLSIYDPLDECFVDRFVWGVELQNNPPGGRHRLNSTYVRDAFRERRSTAWNRSELERLAEHSVGVAEGLERGLVSAMAVPLVWQNRVFGMMNMRSSVDNAYGPHDIELAEQAAAQIAGGFASAFRYEQTVKEAQLRKSLAAMSLAAGSDHRLERIFAAIEPELEKLIEYDRISVTLVEQDSDRLRLVYVRGIAVPGFAEGDTVQLPRGHSSWLWQATILPNDPVTAGAMEQAGLHSWIQVPLGNPSSGPIGYLSLRRAARNFYDESHKEILEQVSTYITPGVQNAIAYQRESELAAQRERAAHLEQQARELERVNRAKSEFFSAVSHELRTPLTSVVAFADILARNRDRTLSERDAKHLEIIRRNAAQLKVLINDLLDVSQMESGRLELALRPVNLGKLLRDVADSFAPAFEQNTQKLAVAVPRRDVEVEADPDRITQVVSNLLANANKFAPAHTAVELKLETQGDHALLSVIDHGPGVPLDDRGNLFTPFFRADNPATREVEGTGLGLAISKRLVDLHHGTISVDETPGGGATFFVRLPLAKK